MKHKTSIMAILVVSALVFFAFFASAQFIPNDDPFRVEGTLLINSSAAPSGAELTAYVSSALYKTHTSDGSGNYVVTVAGSANDPVDLYLCGINASSLSLIPYGVATENIDLALQADGTPGCTCDAVCVGGTCVNPGSTGVCSSDPFYCDDDGLCEAAFGETTATCPADCPSGPGPTGGSGGGGGGGGGGSGGGGGGIASQTECADDEDNDGDGLVDLADPDCSSANDDDESGSTGGSGSSGGSSACVENWVCTDWEPCVGGTQTRVCHDWNLCGDDSTKPAEEQSCEDSGLGTATTTDDGSNDPSAETTPTGVGQAVGLFDRVKANWKPLLAALLVVVALAFFAVKRRKKTPTA